MQNGILIENEKECIISFYISALVNSSVCALNFNAPPFMFHLLLLEADPDIVIDLEVRVSVDIDTATLRSAPCCRCRGILKNE